MRILVRKKSPVNRHMKYYKCERCGFISKNSVYCPVCKKEGLRIKLK